MLKLGVESVILGLIFRHYNIAGRHLFASSLFLLTCLKDNTVYDSNRFLDVLSGSRIVVQMFLVNFFCFCSVFESAQKLTVMSQSMFEHLTFAVPSPKRQ